jgi:hypothetical protein
MQVNNQDRNEGANHKKPSLREFIDPKLPVSYAVVVGGGSHFAI